MATTKECPFPSSGGVSWSPSRHNFPHVFRLYASEPMSTGSRLCLGRIWTVATGKKGSIERCRALRFLVIALAGAASKHLHSWIQATQRIQKAWRSHRFKRQVEDAARRRTLWLQAVVQLQSTWRGWHQRNRYLSMRAAAISMQACNTAHAHGFWAFAIKYKGSGQKVLSGNLSDSPVNVR